MSLRETIETIRSSPVPDNEEMAKFQILAPILAGLSWDPFGQEVRWEHPVGGKKTGGKADIALRAEGRIWALIEAKAPGANLNNHVEQVLGYAFYEGVDICALSDGLQWWLYLPREPGSHEERRFSVLHLNEDPVDQVCSDLDTFLGRESLLSGRAVERARQVRGALREAAHLEQEMPGIWQRMLDEPDSELIELIGQRVYDRLSLRPGREQIVAAIRSKPIPPRPTDPKPDPPSPSRRARNSPLRHRTSSDPKPDPPSPSRPTAVMLWGERHPIRLHSDILVTVVEELYKRHADSFDQTVEPLEHREWQYVSRDRERVAGENPKQTPSGYFVNVRMAAKSHRQRWTSLLEAFGHSGSDLQLLYEETPSEKPPGRQQTKRPAAVRLWGERHPVRTHTEILMTVVDELNRRHPHDFDRAVEPLKSGKSQYVSRDSSRVRGTRIKQTPSGHYVDINLSAQSIRERVVRLLEALGHRESDLEYVYE